MLALLGCYHLFLEYCFCHVLRVVFFYDSEMHVDIIVNICVGCIDWKPHERGTSRNEAQQQAQQEQQNQQRMMNSISIRESTEGINKTR